MQMASLEISPITLSARQDAIGRTLSHLRDYTASAAELAGLEKYALYNLQLAADEIATNIIMYAYDDPEAHNSIVAQASIEEDQLVLILEDSGIPYDPRQREIPTNLHDPLETREIGGLGIYFAIKSVDQYEYRYHNGHNQNIFIMKRPRVRQRRNRMYNLLVLEPDEAARVALAVVLRSKGYLVQMAADRHEALTRLLELPFDLLIIAESTPQEETYRLLKRLRVVPRLMRQLTMIISSDTSHVVRCLDLGADDYVKAPWEATLLGLRVESVLRHSQRSVAGRIIKLSNHIKQILLSDEPELRFGKEMNLDRFLEMVLIQLQGIYNADAGTLYLRTDMDALRFAIVRTDSLGYELGGTSGNPIDFPTLPLYDRKTGEPNNHNIATHVALSGDTINIPDIQDVSDFDFSGTLVFDRRNHYRSISSLTVPLKDQDDFVIGVVQLINAQDEDGNIIPFDDAQRVLVEALLAHTAVILSNHRLLQRQDKLSKMENDLKLGRRIQRDFMPSRLPEVPGWDIDARFLPAREVAGDFYDLFLTGDYIVMLVADVCDKGVGAALFMALARSLIRAYIEQASVRLASLPSSEYSIERVKHEVERVLVTTNDYILRHHHNLYMFTTLFIGLIEPRSGKMLYVNGGHTPAPFLLDADGGLIARLGPTGPAVGMFAEATYDVEEMDMNEGDTLLAFTDGVLDVQNMRGDKLGHEAVQEVVMMPADSISVLLNRIQDRLFNHMGQAPQYDDFTLVGVARCDAP